MGLSVSRPFGTRSHRASLPNVEMLGYSHGVPPGHRVGETLIKHHVGLRPHFFSSTRFPVTTAVQTRNNLPRCMIQYHQLLRQVLEHGKFKPDRTGTGTYALFGAQARFPLAEGFPLL